MGMTFDAHYDPRRVRPALAVAVLVALAGAAAGLAGVWFGWILTAFTAWTAANLVRRMRRRDAVLTLDAAGARDHRTGAAIAWSDVASMRTVDRRVAVAKVPLLELVPAAPLPRDRGALAAAVVRGDLAFVDARDDRRLMLDLRHLDVTPEQVLAAARERRGA